MEESDIVPAKDNSSFEILPSSEEEYYVSITMQSSTLLGSFSENMNSYFSAESVAAAEAEDKNLWAKSNEFQESNFSSLGQSLSYLDLHEEFPEKPQFAPEVLKAEPASENATKIEKTTHECKISSFNGMDNTSRFEESISRDEKDAEAADRYQLVESVGNCIRRERATDLRRDTEESIVTYVAECPGDQERLSFSNGKFFRSQNSADQPFAENAVEQSDPNRNKCSANVCSVVKRTFKLYRWFRNNTYLRSVANGARASFHSFLNTVELEMNLLMGMKEPLQILIVADVSDAKAIQESFSRALSGQVVIARHPEVENPSVPLLPVGYNSAFQLAQSKISNARCQYDSENTSVIVTTVKFIEEIYPQRWQLLTMLWLDDPNFPLNLHNFTATIPVPNEYINWAQQLTPDKYPFKELGLAATLEEAMRCATQTAVSKDAEEILCGITHNVHLQSASDVLAAKEAYMCFTPAETAISVGVTEIHAILKALAQEIIPILVF